MTLATDNLPFPWFTHCQSTLILVFECGLVRKKPLVSKAFPRSILRGVTAGFWEILHSRSWECRFPSSPWLFHTHTKGFLCGESTPGPSAFLRVTKPHCSPPELCWILCPLPSHPCVGGIHGRLMWPFQCCHCRDVSWVFQWPCAALRALYSIKHFPSTINFVQCFWV